MENAANISLRFEQSNSLEAIGYSSFDKVYDFIPQSACK